MTDSQNRRLAAPGKLKAPYPVEGCANVDCPVGGSLEQGAYLFKDWETDRLCVFCADCTAHVELNEPERFMLVAL